MKRNRTVIFLASILGALLLASAAPAEQGCAGDADGSADVTVDEILQAVGSALDGCPEPPEVCNGDADCDGRVVVSEIVRAVGNALSGCEEISDVVVDTAWLASRLGEVGVQIVDARVSGFSGGHIPGALPLSPYALAMTVEGVPFQVVGPQIGQAALSAIGLRRGTIVVVYGAPPEIDPARVVWALRYLGHEDVRYLDGGWNAWVAASAPIAAGPPASAGPSDYEVDAVHGDIRVTGDWVLEQLGEAPHDAAAIQIVDARSLAEYDVGHIPTALSVDWALNLQSGLLRSRAELAAFYGQLGLDPLRTTVVYCTAGWRASVGWLTLTWLGFEDVRVYDGSWLEWGAGGRFPIEVTE